MVAIITGDIIGSQRHEASLWLPLLKAGLSRWGDPILDWEIYRGDEFQLRVPGQVALERAIHLKALMKTIKGLDVRMSIGLGEETFMGQGVGESNGPAYRLSGRNFERLRDARVNLTLATGSSSHDMTMNLMLRLALDFMDQWSPVSAEIVVLALERPDALQQEIADHLQIAQPAVSQRQKRARLPLVLDLLAYYALFVETYKYDTVP